MAEAVNGRGNNQDNGFEIFGDRPIHDARPMKVCCVGAGLMGMHLAQRVEKYGPGIELKVYDRNEAVGGTWRTNKYPGVAVDSPSVAYTLTWAPWHGWSRFQAAGADCLRYCEHVASITNINDITSFNTAVQSATWDESKCKWIVKTKNIKTEEENTEEFDIFVNAGGILSQPKWPDVPGLKSFKGKLLHSAYWDPSADLKGKKVALVGAGSSSIQILPEIQKQAGHIDVYIRSSTWIIPMFASTVRDEYWGIDTSQDPLDAFTNEDPARINPWYTDEDRKKWQENPETLLKHRKDITTNVNTFFAAGFTIEGSDISKQFREAVTEATVRKLVKKPELQDVFIPNWDIGCRRATPGVQYHRAIQEDNVAVIRAGTAEITETGLIDTLGDAHEYDAIIFATGYNTNYAPPFQTSGLDGFSLNSPEYLKNPRGYMIAHCPRMPNYFQIGGPLLASFNGDFLPGQEKTMDHIFKFILKMQRERYKRVVVKEKCADNLMAYADKYLQRTVHKQDCSSWYKGGSKDGKIRAIWVGSVLHQMEALKNPRWEDFEWEAMDSQDGPEQFLWLGNGMSHWDLTDDTSPYLYAVQDTSKRVERFDPNRIVNLQGFDF